MTTINLSEYQKLPFSCITPLYFVLYAVIPLHLSRVLYKSTLFMQNKPNLPDAQMNVNAVITKDCENKRLRRGAENKPKTNPTCRGVASGEAGSNSACSLCTYGLWIVYTVLWSRKPSSLRERTGCWSLRMALASTCLTRSRVTLKILPTSSSV